LLNGEVLRDAGKLLRKWYLGEASLSRAVRRSSPICASMRVAGVTFPSRTRVDTAFRELNKKWDSTGSAMRSGGLHVPRIGLALILPFRAPTAATA